MSVLLFGFTEFHCKSDFFSFESEKSNVGCKQGHGTSGSLICHLKAYMLQKLLPPWLTWQICNYNKWHLQTREPVKLNTRKERKQQYFILQIKGLHLQKHLFLVSLASLTSSFWLESGWGTGQIKHQQGDSKTDGSHDKSSFHADLLLLS